MKNITVSIDEETYRHARMIAAQRDTSVSALVNRFLMELAATETQTERLKRQEREPREHITDFDGSDRLPAMMFTAAEPEYCRIFSTRTLEHRIRVWLGELELAEGAIGRLTHHKMLTRGVDVTKAPLQGVGIKER